jgi:hypothetical protein
MTRGRRFSTCRCCGALAASVYCDGCGAHHTQRAAVAEAAVLALWGTAGIPSMSPIAVAVAGHR